MAGGPERGSQARRSIEAVEEAPNSSSASDLSILLQVCLEPQPIAVPITRLNGPPTGNYRGPIAISRR